MSARKREGRAFIVTAPGAEPRMVAVSGRVAWALERLAEAGSHGVTAITQPAPRWSAYVFELRKLGVPVETRHEPHAGPFPGHHGRYLLLARAHEVHE